MTQKQIKPRRATKGKTANGRGLAALVEEVQKDMTRITLPDFVSGDTVRVHVRIIEGGKERIQAFEGVVIARNNKGSGKSFTVRKISHGVGVERVFGECSPKLANVERVQAGKVRRSKLYYIRELEGRAAKIERRVAGRGTKEATSKKAKAAATA
jgi:large subunit ribosomal protein L19